MFLLDGVRIPSDVNRHRTDDGRLGPKGPGPHGPNVVAPARVKPVAGPIHGAGLP